ncbi:GNAT family N-acetyltransferase [Paenibacillus beijingensis]|uniref:Alanine acetyltransferase n=1 Tax=Paenibacillus beijingensis TaxID=1126833 RepID=A0A0D5NQN0_9BACL|nr:GNAT family protein [Paenibacillus beijingensis]AJY77297.1 alanine acetyltransferase [Paenibacillus beijingensis]
MKRLLETARLLLCSADHTDAPVILDFVKRNAADLEQWEIKRTPQYYTEPMQAELLARDERESTEGRLFKVWLVQKSDKERIIGSVALSNIVRGAFQSCHLGYKMDSGLRNRGFMTEAIRAVVRHAFADMRLHRIEANIMPRNEASLQVVRKLGFQDEGLARRYLNINGKWEDHIHMVLLNDRIE